MCWLGAESGIVVRDCGADGAEAGVGAGVGLGAEPACGTNSNVAHPPLSEAEAVDGCEIVETPNRSC